MRELSCEAIISWIDSWAEVLIEKKDYLNELDTPIGDDDHGTNMARGAKELKVILKDDYSDSQQLTKKIAMALLTKVGGASGVIYGTAFLEMSQEIELSRMLKAGINGIIKRGKAEVGDKTLLDVWQPVSELVEVDSLTLAKIDAAVQSTKPMLAKKGRSEFVGEASIGHLDPGAVSSGYLFEQLVKELSK
ncbi:MULTISPECIES: dihydroxyacetone kinase subunit DhaL [unclassified Enterococcus]|uniref:dihydroxyacetone kinase subunit DhaL n=1 Tax=unclassified Enterococcus TaxID=2608891 RepID=UPI0015556E94|nr:dihydroxyacetone kinase subunit L [Enterococcus sp. MMGLQ5-2]MBS7583309.1 dihydroxyacetone kinase subunit L [Enterococcus sp. MMGLQ5-1]NPD11169.1 dihydroxyacetone kinase subunit L [Enterococcus sp. MMGLQ5-1]NPD35912.1 dihydroxyacetone kinase subunit L [Enterococcus sp. MMGLQ5-2]